ncbi:hypothetical protein CDL15_Pgr010203 [Punica granatum]|uniref:Protein RESISTANCE TO PHYTOPHTHORA 1, chloroplastic n=1 Tax=Punica granatum TaxID=22663 RepID=A0A218XRL6_PUNGR|nr:hypothetical protein CDL15_Pgr010203 [Punica granatum]
MNAAAATLMSPATLCCSRLAPPAHCTLRRNALLHYPQTRSRILRIAATSSNDTDAQAVVAEEQEEERAQQKPEVQQTNEPSRPSASSSSSSSSSSSVNAALEKDLKKVVQKTASTFAPRASMATKNPAVPGTALYTVFEVQGYALMLLGGALSFNLLFPSNEPDIWRLMGMWSIWMFTIPSLRARDCSKNEKEALNYLFLLIPLLNVIIPFFWKSFAIVWSADTVAFFGMYAWKV